MVRTTVIAVSSFAMRAMRKKRERRLRWLRDEAL
jgi:hypothetical protein